MPRLGDPKVTLVLILLILLGLVVKAEVWPDPEVGSEVVPTGAKAGVLLGQGKAVKGPGPQEKNAPSPHEECPDAQPVWEGVATGDLETDLFETRTDRLIVSYEVLERPQERALPNFQATVEDENGRDITSGEIPSPQPGDPVRADLTPNMGRAIVDTVPGSYKVAVSPSNSDRRYAILVEECGVPEVT